MKTETYYNDGKARGAFFAEGLQSVFEGIETEDAFIDALTEAEQNDRQDAGFCAYAGDLNLLPEFDADEAWEAYEEGINDAFRKAWEEWGETWVKASLAWKCHPLAGAVCRQLGHEDLTDDPQGLVSELRDVSEHGANCGFGGFTYYKDTCHFTARWRSKIAWAVEELADDLGEDPIAMVKGFGCVNADVPTKAVAKALWCGGDDSDDVTDVESALAWFALEEVANRAVNAWEEI